MISLQLSSLNLLKLMFCSLIHTKINYYFYRKNLPISIKHDTTGAKQTLSMLS